MYYTHFTIELTKAGVSKTPYFTKEREDFHERKTHYEDFYPLFSARV